MSGFTWPAVERHALGLSGARLGPSMWARKS